MEFLSRRNPCINLAANCDVCRWNHPDLAGYQKGL